MPTTLAAQERLISAYEAWSRADKLDDGSIGAANDCIRAQNRLIDACLACGMDLDGDEFVFGAKAYARFLLDAA